MKEIVALLAFVVIAAPTIYLAVKKSIDAKLTLVLLGFSLVAGFLIANYDLISRFKWGQVELETATKVIGEAKQSALNDIAAEVKDQKQSIRLLITNVNDSRDKLEQQRSALEKLIKTATELQSKIEEQKRVTLALDQSARNTKNDIAKLNAASAQIALTVIRATYFSIETKNEFGGPRSKKAVEEILADLNRILPMVIPDERQRSEWVKSLQTTLPARK